MIITKNNNNNIYTYKHTTTQTEEEHVADETKQIINLICQDFESFMKTHEHAYINYCSICKDIFKFVTTHMWYLLRLRYKKQFFL